jgi:general stress protein 26
MTEELSRQQAIDKVSEMIKGIRIAMLATVTPEGTIHSRPMATQRADFKGELLFLTRQESSKTDDIAHQSQVTLTCADSKGCRFVSLSGRAERSKDRATVHELWSPLYKAGFRRARTTPRSP